MRRPIKAWLLDKIYGLPAKFLIKCNPIGISPRFGGRNNILGWLLVKGGEEDLGKS